MNVEQHKPKQVRDIYIIETEIAIQRNYAYFLIAIPTVYLVLSVRVKEEAGVEGSVIRAKKYKCLNDAEARKVKNY